MGLRCPDAKERFELKRVVGLPGERVSWRGHEIRVNENYPGSQTLQLADQEFFVAGDNRSQSRDSRAYGPVHASDILGLANHTHV